MKTEIKVKRSLQKIFLYEYFFTLILVIFQIEDFLLRWILTSPTFSICDCGMSRALRDRLVKRIDLSSQTLNPARLRRIFIFLWYFLIVSEYYRLVRYIGQSMAKPHNRILTVDRLPMRSCNLGLIDWLYLNSNHKGELITDRTINELEWESSPNIVTYSIRGKLLDFVDDVDFIWN